MLFLALTLTSLLPAPAFALGDSGSVAQVWLKFGKISKLQGQAWVVTDGKTTLLHEGSEINRGDTVRTGADGRAIVRLGDKDSAVMMRPDSEITFKGTDHWEATIGKGGALFRVKNPAGHPNHLVVKTRAATMGVRGTTFYVEDPVGESNLPETPGAHATTGTPVFFCACNGSVAVTDSKGGSKIFVSKHHDAPTDIAGGTDTLAARLSPSKRTAATIDHSDADIAELNEVIDSP